MGVTYAFAFGAKSVQAALTTSFFVNFVTRHYIENAALNNQESQVAELVASSVNLARHTNILAFFRPNSDKCNLAVREYTWTSRARPCGVDLPLQCEKCGSIQSLKIKVEGDHKTATAVCKGCGKSHAFALAKGFHPVPSGERGQWVVRDI